MIDISQTDSGFTFQANDEETSKYYSKIYFNNVIKISRSIDNDSTLIWWKDNVYEDSHVLDDYNLGAELDISEASHDLLLDYLLSHNVVEPTKVTVEANTTIRNIKI